MAKKIAKPAKNVQRTPKSAVPKSHTRLLGGLTLVSFTLLISAVFFTAGMQQRLLGSRNVAAVVSAVLADLTNQDRAQAGMGGLTYSPELQKVAQAKADDMAAKGYFAHISPEGVDPWHWFNVADYKFVYAGENLAIDFSDSGDVNSAWMRSPTHRENILNPQYTQIGIAIAQGYYQGHPTTFVVQEFATPAETQNNITEQMVPVEPTRVAQAKSKPAATSEVLGSEATTVTKKAVASVPDNVLGASTVAPDTSGRPPAVAQQSAIASPRNSAPTSPTWSPLVAFPRTVFETSFYLIAVLILVALALETGLELRWHHRRHFFSALALFCVMGVLFVVASVVFFPPPVIAAVAI